jgi:hypothetical protein
MFGLTEARVVEASRQRRATSASACSSEHMLPQNRYSLSEAPTQAFPNTAPLPWEVLEALAMIPCRRHGARRKIEETSDEFIRALHFNSKRSDRAARKVSQVHSNDDVCVAANSSRQHMPVARIWALQIGTGSTDLTELFRRAPHGISIRSNWPSCHRRLCFSASATERFTQGKNRWILTAAATMTRLEAARRLAILAAQF